DVEGNAVLVSDPAVRALGEPGHQRHACGDAGGRRGVGAPEPGPTLGELVQVRRVDDRMSVGRETVTAPLVDADQDDVGWCHRPPFVPHVDGNDARTYRPG